MGVVTFSKETHTYFTTLTPSVGVGVGDGDGGAAGGKHASNVGETIRVPVLCGDSTTAGLAVCPATHLLCQYLAYSIIASPPSEAVKRFSVMCVDPKNLTSAASPPAKSLGGGGSRFPPLGKRVLELGCGAGLAGIVAALALSRKEREANAELCKAAAILDFDKIDLDDLSSDSDSEEGDSAGDEGGMDEDSLGVSGGLGGKKPGKDDQDAIVVCTDGDPEAVELCRENVTRDLFLAEDEHGASLLDEGAVDGIDIETAAAIAAAGQSGVKISPAGERNPSDHRLVRPLDASRKRIIDSRRGSAESLSDSSSSSSEGFFGGGVEGDVRVLARTLRWGDQRTARDIMKEATAATSKVFATTDLDADFRASMAVAPSAPRDEHFDTVMAADVVLPTTSEEDLAGLFQSVDQCLREGGHFLLSFASRDGHRSPLKLLEAASGAGFKVDCIPEEEFVPRGDFMPPTLDAKLLVMRRDEDAADFNGLLGSDSCRIFPGLKSQAKKAAT